MNEDIKKYLEDILGNNFKIKEVIVKLETPPKKNMGDLAFGCFFLAKELKKSPLRIAEDLAIYINQDTGKPENISTVNAEGPYLNIHLTNESFSENFEEFLAKENIYGDTSNNKKKTIYIDYIGANVGKPLHIGHMCTPSHGQVFINLFKKLNYNVISDSHIGDWGIIFGKLIVAYKKYGDEQKLEENAVDHLFELYVKISTDVENDTNLENEFRETFKKLSHGDEEMKAIWKKFTKSSIQAMDIQLSRLFVKAKYNIGESFYEGLGLAKMEEYPDLSLSMKEIVQELISKKIATQNDDGSVGVVFPDEMKISSCILQKRDGTHGYLASDLASIYYRVNNWDIEKILYFVDVRQQLHLKQTFTISKMADWLDDSIEITHTYNGFISLKDGAMSTRKGKIIKLKDLLDTAEKKARDIILEKRDDFEEKQLSDLSKIVSIGAIKYGYLKKSRETDVIFDWDEFMSFEGNSGPYIQYAYVRARRILEKSKLKLSYKNLCFENVEEKQLIKHILEFPNIIDVISKNYFAHILCTYTYELTKCFNSMYNNIAILTEEDKNLRNSRLVLVETSMKILEESFDILGIPLPKEM